MKKKITVKHDSIRINAYEVIYRAIEEALSYGWRRAHKYVDKPDQDTIVNQMHQAIMDELCTYILFDNEWEE